MREQTILQVKVLDFPHPDHAGGLNGARSEAEKSKILVFVSEAEFAEAIRHELEADGYGVALAYSAAEALIGCLSGQVSALVLDQTTPDGSSLVERLRGEGCTTPVLMIGTPDSVEERIRVLKAGADDCLPKPIDVHELVVRVEALLRRSGYATRLKVGDLEMDLIERKVRCMGRSVDLLPLELKLLEYFMRRPGKVVTRMELLRDVWDSKFIDRTNTVDVQVGKLRRKLDPTGEQRFILTIRSAGFKLIAGR